MADRVLRTVTYKTPGRGRRVLLCLIIGMALLSISLRMQAHVDWRKPFSLSPHMNAAPKTADTGRKTRELSLSEHSLFVLQLGAFTQESAARQLAQEFMGRGAAGFIQDDGSAYRVLAAAYPTRAEAQAVQTRLAAQSISTYIHPCVQKALQLRAGGTAAQVNALEDALDYLDGLGEKLYALSSALDAREIEPAAAREALISEGNTSAALAQRLQAAFVEEIPVSLAPMHTLLSQVSDAGEAMRNETSAARTGAALKRCQLTVFFGLDAFAQGLGFASSGAGER